jgi:hypothetical protein
MGVSSAHQNLRKSRMGSHNAAFSPLQLVRGFAKAPFNLLGMSMAFHKWLEGRSTVAIRQFSTGLKIQPFK